MNVLNPKLKNKILPERKWYLNNTTEVFKIDSTNLYNRHDVCFGIS